MTTDKLYTVSKKALFTATLLLSLTSHEAEAQQETVMESKDVFATLTKYEVKQAAEQVFRKAISHYVHHALEQETNILTEAFYEQDKPSVLWLIERWSNKAAFEKFRSNSMMEIDSLAANCRRSPIVTIDVKDLEPLTKKEWRRGSQKDDKPLTIMLFVDSKPGTEDVFEKVYHTAMPAFRGEKGVINYQLSRFIADSTKFVTYEKFRSDDAFQYHLNFPPIQPVIDYLNTSIKTQPFQAGIHRLIQFAPVMAE